jgi:hypothetical protein
MTWLVFSEDRFLWFTGAVLLFLSEGFSLRLQLREEIVAHILFGACLLP